MEGSKCHIKKCDNTGLCAEAEVMQGVGRGRSHIRRTNESGTTRNMRTVVRMYAARRNCNGKSLDKLPAELPAMILITNAALKAVRIACSARVDSWMPLIASGT